MKLTKEQVVQGYLLNSPKVVAEMLYETIERYENRKCDNCKYNLSDNGNFPLYPCSECSRFYPDSWSNK